MPALNSGDLVKTVDGSMWWNGLRGQVLHQTLSSLKDRGAAYLILCGYLGKEVELEVWDIGLSEIKNSEEFASRSNAVP